MPKDPESTVFPDCFAFPVAETASKSRDKDHMAVALLTFTLFLLGNDILQAGRNFGRHGFHIFSPRIHPDGCLHIEASPGFVQLPKLVLIARQRPLSLK